MPGEWNKQNPERARELRRLWIKNNPEKAKLMARRALIKYKYNLTLEEFDSILKSQNGVCAICKKPEGKMAGSKFCVDHDHITNKVRGIICRLCNIGIGNFKESLDILRSAVAYLEKSND